MLRPQIKKEEGLFTRMMRAGDQLIVGKKGSKTVFEISGEKNSFAAPMLGVKIRLSGGSHDGAEGRFCIIWLTGTERVNGFLFHGMEVLLLDQLSFGQELIVVET